jgi:hypothetical protein
MLLHAHDLHDHAKRIQEEVGISMDATPLTKTLIHVTFILTITDTGAMDPRTMI